jgi:hypothetical protein
MLTYDDIKTWIDANINTNGVAAITGALSNQSLIAYLLNNFANLEHDETRPYVTGQYCYYEVATGIGAFYKATADSTGAFDIADWEQKTPLTEEITDTIAIGSNTIAHQLGKKPKIIYIQNSDGANIPFNVTATDTTTVTVESLEEYVDAIITIQAI